MANKKKEAPKGRGINVIPPNLEYKYFADSSNHPFRHTTEEFQLVNAWWLAESSLLAYAESNFATEQFAKAGLQLVGPQPLSGPSTQCYVAHTDEFVIVAFRGTLSGGGHRCNGKFDLSEDSAPLSLV